MQCCTMCFSNTNIQSYIDEYDKIGTCDYCESEGVAVLEVSALGDYVRTCLQKGYENPSTSDVPYPLLESNVQTVMEVLDCEEDIFSEKLDWDIRTQLVSALLNESAPSYRDIAQGAVDEFIDEETEVVLKGVLYGGGDFYFHTWEGFKDLVMHGNRFFDLSENQVRVDILETFGSFFSEMEMELNEGKTLFRARKNMPSGLDVLDRIEPEIGPPPANRAIGLRMNPTGISYLYLAEDIKTCKDEIKADKDETIGVGQFEIIQSLRLIDLSRVPRLKNTSIFSPDYNHELHWVRYFLKHFCEEISKPVEENHDLEYVPTQLLCEYIRFKGYDGIRYRSSLTRKDCYTLFCGQQKQGVTDCSKNAFIKDFRDWVKLVKFQQYEIKTVDIESVTTYSSTGSGRISPN
ncbi:MULTISPECIES: RES domain-containing protein [Exiguobacterium]|uniref:RES domain-containing protein n=1 Tax=Exiguobacterium TaxID=33986 RepID=UPI0028A992EF|nr:RES domain-containing protein [Exiguobacterium profundum]